MANVKVLDRVTPFHYVYFIRANETGLIKIGRSRNLGQRLRELTGRVGPLTLLSCIPTFDVNFESQVHRLVRNYRCDDMGKEREWFTIPEEELLIILKEILRGFRNWSDEGAPRVNRGKSFLSFENGIIEQQIPNRKYIRRIRRLERMGSE